MLLAARMLLAACATPLEPAWCCIRVSTFSWNEFIDA